MFLHPSCDATAPAGRVPGGPHRHGVSARMRAVESDDRAWYVAYGSNMCRDRLLAYLEGTVAPSTAGRARGVTEAGSRSARYGPHRGCADPTPPTADRALELAQPVRFRGRSPRWGGGVAFLDLHPAEGCRTPARAWLLTVTQVLSVVGQESRRPVDPPRSLLEGMAVGETVPLGGGWYDTLLRLDDIDGRPAVTVTTAQPLPLTEPTAPYLATIAAGRAERPALPSGDRDAAGRRGVRGSRR